MNLEDLRTVPGSPEEWLEYAEGDLHLAQLAHRSQTIRRELVCFHAQQAAEKAIKAVLVSRGLDFPLTHDIGQLLALAEKNNLHLPDQVRKAGRLTPYAVETRYPGSSSGVGDAQVLESIGLAEQTLTWARNAISARGEDAT